MAQDNPHVVFRAQSTDIGSSNDYSVLTIDEAVAERDAGHTNEQISAGGLFCVHQIEMVAKDPTYRPPGCHLVRCTQRASHFRHNVLTNVSRTSDVKEGDARDVGQCPCMNKASREHLDAQKALCEIPPGWSVKYVQFRDCRKHFDVVYSPSVDTTVQKEVFTRAANGRRVFLDVVYMSPAARGGAREMVIEVLRTHATAESAREGIPFLEVKASHILEKIDQARRSDKIPPTVIFSCEARGDLCKCKICAELAEEDARKTREAVECLRRRRDAEECARRKREDEEQARRKREAEEKARQQIEEKARRKREVLERLRQKKKADERERQKREADERARQKREADERKRQMRECVEAQEAEKTAWMEADLKRLQEESILHNQRMLAGDDVVLRRNKRWNAELKRRGRAGDKKYDRHLSKIRKIVMTFEPE